MQTNDRLIHRMELFLRILEGAKKNDANILNVWSIDISLIEEAIEALRLSAQQREPGVKVKELMWELIDDEWWATDTIVGGYEVRQARASVRTRFPGTRQFTFFDGTIDAAKSAAQANYEQRIIAAIDWKQLSETGKELPENTEHSANIANVSVGELAQYLNEYIFKDVDDVARALLSRYIVGRRG